LLIQKPALLQLRASCRRRNYHCWSSALPRRKLLCRRSWSVNSSCQLPLANPIEHFNARNRTARRPERFDTETHSYYPLDSYMILFHKSVEIFRVADDNRGLVHLVAVCDRYRIGSTPIVILSAPGYKWLCVRAPRPRPDREWHQQQVNRVPFFADCAVIRPFPLDFHPGLVHTLASTTGYCWWRNYFSNSSTYLIIHRLRVEWSTATPCSPIFSSNARHTKLFPSQTSSP
jgi:hypothetical protein